jgi:hypothetical protein
MNRYWREEAACKGADTKLFYGERGKGKTIYKEAKKYCEQCPVLADCFQFVMEVESQPQQGMGRHGYFAGMTPLQREHYQRQRKTHVHAS